MWSGVFWRLEKKKQMNWCCVETGCL